jgi:hypothetical protein
MTSTTDNNDRNYESKIIQHEPAWTLHAYLRFIEQPYSCDFSPSEVALGCSTLPIVMTREIDGGIFCIFTNILTIIFIIIYC